MTKAEREFIKALKDGSIQRALEDMQKKLADALKAWDLGLEMAIEICKTKKYIIETSSKEMGKISN